MFTTLLLILTFVRLMQSKNAPSPMLLTLVPLVTLVRLMQIANASFPMLYIRA